MESRVKGERPQVAGEPRWPLAAHLCSPKTPSEVVRTATDSRSTPVVGVQSVKDRNRDEPSMLRATGWCPIPWWCRARFHSGLVRIANAALVSLSLACAVSRVPKERTETRVFSVEIGSCTWHNCAACSRNGNQPRCRRETRRMGSAVRTNSWRETRASETVWRAKSGAACLEICHRCLWRNL